MYNIIDIKMGMGILLKRDDKIQPKSDLSLLKEQMLKTEVNGQNIYR